VSTRHLLRHIVWAHCLASWIAGMVLAGMVSRGVLDFMAHAFTAYMAPLCLPIAGLIVERRQALVAYYVYGAVFGAVFAVLRRKQAKDEIEERKRILAAQRDPIPVAMLAYHGEEPREKERFGRMELIAAGSSIVDLIGGAVCFRLFIGQGAFAQRYIGVWV
jgi:hypothetical protein